MDVQHSGDATGVDGDDALGRVAAALRPGWIVLQDCAFGGGGDAAPARAQYALLHPHVGIALLDLLPCAKDAAAADRLREALNAAEFPERFVGLPPIVHLRLGPQALSGLGARLDRAFDRRPPIALRGGDAWTATACRVLGARLPPATAAGRSGEPMGGQRALTVFGPRPGATPAPVPARPGGGWRALGRFWAAVLLVAGGGAATLQLLGPREGGRAPDARQTVDATPPEGGRGSAAAAGVLPVAPQEDGAGAPAAGGRSKPPSGLLKTTNWTPEPAPPRAGSGFAGEDGGAGFPLGAAAPTPSLAALLRELSEAAPPASEEAFRGGQERGSAAPADLAPAAPSSRTGADAPDAAGETAGGGVPAPPRPAAPPAVDAPAPTPDDHATASGDDGMRSSHGGARAVRDAEAARPLAAEDGVPPVEVIAAFPAPPAPLHAGAGLAGPAVPRPAAPPEPGAAATTGSGAGGSAGADHAPPMVAPATVQALIRRGDSMVALGDIAAARLLYARAAAAGNGNAAKALGRTYEPAFLAGIRASIPGDPAMALTWYRRAAALGDEQAGAWLARHGSGAAERVP